MAFTRRKTDSSRGMYTPRKRRRTNNKYASSGNGPVNLRRLSVRTGNKNIFATVRTATLVSNAAYVSGSQFGALSFALTDLPNYTDFTNLYDEYRIKAVRVFFVPTTNVNTDNAGANVSLPALYTWIDTDDSTTPTAITQGQQFESFKCHGQLSGMRQRSLIPEVSNALYTGAAFTGYGQVKNQWIDNQSSGVLHYGLKYAIINSAANQGAIDVVATYYLEFRKSA